VIGLPTSHRARLRLLRRSIVAAVVLVVAFLIVFVRNTGHSTATPINEYGHARVYHPPKTVKATAEQKAAAISGAPPAPGRRIFFQLAGKAYPHHTGRLCLLGQAVHRPLRAVPALRQRLTEVAQLLVGPTLRRPFILHAGQNEPGAVAPDQGDRLVAGPSEAPPFLAGQVGEPGHFRRCAGTAHGGAD